MKTDSQKGSAQRSTTQPGFAVATWSGCILMWVCVLCATKIAGAQFGNNACCHRCTGDCVQGVGLVCMDPPFQVFFDSACEGVEACILPGGGCVQIDELCCSDTLGGTPLGNNSVCEAASGSCCYTAPDNTVVCDVESIGACAGNSGTYGGDGTICCDDVQACCNDGAWSKVPTSCCLSQGGTVSGSATTCPLEACCTMAATCENLDTLSCDNMGGVPAGLGTACSDFGGTICTEDWACCNPVHLSPAGDPPGLCDNHRIFLCDSEDGTTQLGIFDCADIPDVDGDNVKDACDDCIDADGDGWGNGTGGNVGCANGPAIDCDDSSGNTSDGDEDNICNDDDNCPGDHNPGQEDADGDGVGDACDPCPNSNPNDDDGDDVCDDTDNCSPSDPNYNCNAPEFDCFNPTQEDLDGDGRGDACDPDIDGDSVPNEDDRCDFTPFGVGFPIDLSGPFRGTHRADLDGDCDVDDVDKGILIGLLGFGPGPKNGTPIEDPLCDPCDPCNSCFRQQLR